jgi:hypothetical protein
MGRQMMKEIEMTEADLLRCLDFNAVHSGDAIAQVYFGQAAQMIRLVRREADHWRRKCVAEQGRASEVAADADALANVLERILADADSPPRPMKEPQ